MGGDTADLSTDSVFSGGGELSALMRAYDWPSTPLGPADQWPQTLRSVLTSFIVELPLSLHRREDDVRSNPASESVDTLAAVSTRLEAVTVFYVDDEPDARELVQRILSDQGAKVVTADSADAARQIMASERPDILAADIGMPGEDGYSLIRSIRALPPGQGGSVPAAAVTALARSEDRRRALLAGFQTHVAKPVDVVELVAVVASLVGGTGR